MPLGGSGQPCCCLRGPCGGLAWPRMLLHSQLSHGGAAGCGKLQRQLCRARRGCACIAAATSTAAGTRKAAGAKAAVKDIPAKKSRTRKKEAEPEKEAQEEKPLVLPDWLAGRESELLAQQAEVDARYADRKLGESRRAQVRFLLPLPFARFLLCMLPQTQRQSHPMVLSLAYTEPARVLKRPCTCRGRGHSRRKRGSLRGAATGTAFTAPWRNRRWSCCGKLFLRSARPVSPLSRRVQRSSVVVPLAPLLCHHVELLTQVFLGKCMPSLSPLTTCSVFTLYLRHRCCRKMWGC